METGKLIGDLEQMMQETLAKDDCSVLSGMCSISTASCPGTSRSTTSPSSCITSSCTASPILNPKEVSFPSEVLQETLGTTLFPLPPLPFLHRMPAVPENLPGHAAGLHVRDIVGKPFFHLHLALSHAENLTRYWNTFTVFDFGSNVQGDSNTSICITIEPGLLLKGDILVGAPSFDPHASFLCRICCNDRHSVPRSWNVTTRGTGARAETWCSGCSSTPVPSTTLGWCLGSPSSTRRLKVTSGVYGECRFLQRTEQYNICSCLCFFTLWPTF